MSLISFKEVRPWASAIREKVATRVMPPWHADRQHGTFRNNLSLSQLEIDTIVQWANTGAREGDPAITPKPPQFTDGWQIGKPDQVFEMAEAFAVPARGTVDYQYFEVPTNFTEDKWISSFEILPGSRKGVHHVLVFARTPRPAARASPSSKSWGRRPSS